MAKKINVITLGCSKNLVDSEHLMAQLDEAGYELVTDSNSTDAKIVVINTCGFIGDAKEESINMILEVCDLKRKRRVRKVFVMGCLSERYMAELGDEIPQVDKYYGKFDWVNLIKELKEDAQIEGCQLERIQTTPPHYAYVKIAEGCNHACAYCVTPRIRGGHRSRPQVNILKEVRHWVEQGAKEINLIAQDTTYYGKDLYGRFALVDLLKELALELNQLECHFC